MKTGGSNYTCINGSMENPTIGTYHLFPDKVQSDLQAMFEHGQRQIALLCWFAPLNFPAARDHLWHHVVDSYGGVMFQQHQENLIALIQQIRLAGFTELHFRFGAQGKAMNSEWTEWNSAQAIENWQFIKSVSDLVRANKGGLKVIFDLGVEYANERMDNSTIHGLYCRRIWKQYTDANGTNDSCAYSILHGGDGLLSMLGLFRRSALPMPSSYCFDAYGFEYEALTSAASVLNRNPNELQKPVYIQETNYNDAQSCSDIRRAVKDTTLNFQGIFQWPKLRDHEPNDFPDVFCRRFDNYLIEV